MNKPLMMALAASLTATLWAATHDGGETVEAVKSSGASASPARSSSGSASGLRAREPVTAPAKVAAAASLPSMTLVQDIAAWKQREAIGLKPQSELKAWGASLPPPPPPPVTQKVVHAEPPPPQAPRFPHQWVGRFNDMAVVSGPQQTWVVAQGQVIDGQWRIDRIRDRQMQLTYLPFKQAQTVAMRTP